MTSDTVTHAQRTVTYAAVHQTVKYAMQDTTRPIKKHASRAARIAPHAQVNPRTARAAQKDSIVKAVRV